MPDGRAGIPPNRKNGLRQTLALVHSGCCRYFSHGGTTMRQELRNYRDSSRCGGFITVHSVIYRRGARRVRVTSNRS